MTKLSRRTIKGAGTYTERIIQFGEGNFLRAFSDWVVWKMNKEVGFDASIVIVKPTPRGDLKLFDEQDCLYHLNLQGRKKDEIVDSMDLIDVISRTINPYCEYDAFLKLAEQREMRFVFSNTTEAGIVFDPNCKFSDAPASSFPGKLVQLLFHRFEYFNADPGKGLVILPCELIFHNGNNLKDCILQYIDYWQLGTDFLKWFEVSCAIYNTLVDRITPGYPRDTVEELTARIGVEDHLLDQAELFHLWVIEAPQSLSDEFPADKAGLNVLFVPSEAPYHERKVTLLNGPHTVLSPVGYLSGLNTVRECCEDELVGSFVHKVMYDELMHTLNLPADELKAFADDVMDRFKNPFVKHYLTSIMLNSFPKFKTRDLPGIKTYLEREGHLPKGLVLGLAAVCTYYRGGKRGDDPIVPNDDAHILDLMKELWASGSATTVADGVLGAEFIWGENLNVIPGLTTLLSTFLERIQKDGMRAAIETIL